MHVCLPSSVMSHSFATLWTVAFQTPPVLDFPGKNTWVGCHALLQGIFPTQGSNPHFLHLLHHKQILYPLSHLGSLRKRIIQNKKQYYNLFRKPMKQSGGTVDFKKLLDYSKALELYQKTLFRAHMVHGIWLVIINIRFMSKGLKKIKKNKWQKNMVKSIILMDYFFNVLLVQGEKI